MGEQTDDLTIERPQYFITQRINFENECRHFSTFQNKLFEFNSFCVKEILTIPEYTDDRNFNKVAAVNNKLYLCNGTSVFLIDFGANYLLD